MALAQHEPDRLDETFTPPPPQPDDGDPMLDQEKKWW